MELIAGSKLAEKFLSEDVRLIGIRDRFRGRAHVCSLGTFPLDTSFLRVVSRASTPHLGVYQEKKNDILV